MLEASSGKFLASSIVGFGISSGPRAIGSFDIVEINCPQKFSIWVQFRVKLTTIANFWFYCEFVYSLKSFIWLIVLVSKNSFSEQKQCWPSWNFKNDDVVGWIHDKDTSGTKYVSNGQEKYFCKSLGAAGWESFTETMSIYAHSTRYLCFRVIVIVLDQRDKNISVT